MSEIERPRVGLLVVDLDDTLWTWFDSWHASFSAMLDKLTEVTGLSRDILVPEIKAIHEARGTSEYSWLLDDLPALRAILGGKKAGEVLDPVLHAQNRARVEELRLYPGVADTLRSVRRAGTTIVAYTESLEFWTEWRMRKTKLDGLIDYLYSSPDHDFPIGETRDTVRTLPASEYGLTKTVHLQVPRGISKPNPEILELIVTRHAVPGLRVAYIGDSLDRDVAMAQSVAGVIDVHAAYGQSVNKPGYELLKAVTHWPADQVARERSAASSSPSVRVKPTVSLYEGLHQLFRHFDFGPEASRADLLAAWRQAVEVQMHFNDIGLRLRALALTVLTFTIGATGFLFVNSGTVTIAGLHVSPAVAVPILGMIIWSAFWFVDRQWYHRLLYGSVQEGERLEAILQQNSLPIALGSTITKASAFKLSDAKGITAWLYSKFRPDTTEMHSGTKLTVFYRIGQGALVATMVGVAWISFSTTSPDASPAPSAEPSEITTPAPSATQATPEPGSTDSAE